MSVYKLDSTNFEEKVLNSKDIWLVGFISKKRSPLTDELLPEWQNAAGALLGKVNFGIVDGDDPNNLQVIKDIGVPGYPSAYYWDYGKNKTLHSAHKYSGSGSAGHLTEFANELYSAADIRPVLYEICSQEVFAEQCSERTVCIISFLPHISESSKEER